MEQKTESKLPYDPATLVLSVYTKESKAWSCGEICTPMVTGALFTVAKK